MSISIFFSNGKTPNYIQGHAFEIFRVIIVIEHIVHIVIHIIMSTKFCFFKFENNRNNYYADTDAQ